MDTEALFADVGFWEQAAARCLRRLSEDPANRVVLRSLAESQRKLGQLEESAGTFGRVCQLDTTDEAARYLHGLLSGEPTPIALSGLRPAPFVRVRNFLPTDLHQALVEFMLAHETKFVRPVFRDGKEKPEILQTLGLENNRIPEEWQGRDWFWRELKSLVRRVMPALECGGLELALPATQFCTRAYLDGHFYKPHMDSPKNAPTADRLVNFVYYFNRSPRAFTGGELLLFDSDRAANTYAKDRFTRLFPEDNSIVFFPSAYWHAVLPVHSPSKQFGDSRFSINGHFFKRSERASTPGAGTLTGAVAEVS